MRRRHRLIFTGTVFGAVLGGWLWQRAAAPGEAAPDFATPREVAFDELVAPGGPHSLEGFVVDAAGTARAGVVVDLRGPEGPRWTRTDAEGRFALAELAEGPHALDLLVWGLPPTRHELELPHRGGSRFALDPPRERPRFLPDIVRHDLEGRVTGLAQPEGLEVAVLPLGEARPLEGVVPRRTRTGAAGAFAFEGLAVGTYELWVLPAWAQGGVWPRLARMPLEHAGLREALEVAAWSASLRGEVRDAKREPLEGALVLLSYASDPDRLWPARATDADGRFAFSDLTRGAYALVVQSGALRADREVVVAEEEGVFQVIVLEAEAGEPR